LSNDLINLLNSTTIPIIMLGEDLRIRRFTPEAERAFGLSENDVGKPLTHIHLRIDMPELERWMLDVMRDVKVFTEHVQGKDGTKYNLRIMPYRTLDNKIDGVVLALLDITELLGPASGKANGRTEAEE
jgi:two-component system CheB/CheR fusion protein